MLTSKLVPASPLVKARELDGRPAYLRPARVLAVADESDDHRRREAEALAQRLRYAIKLRRMSGRAAALAAGLSPTLTDQIVNLRQLEVKTSTIDALLSRHTLNHQSAIRA